MSTKKYLDDNGLLYLWGKLKAYFVSAVSYDTTNKKIKVTKNGSASDLVTAATIVTDGGGITSETALSKGTTTGDGNAVTDISVSGHQITLTKGTTFLTSHQDISGKADKATTLSGYGITDAYTKAQVDGLVGSVYKPAGSVSTVSGLGSLTSANEGKVYNFSAAFTTTSDFVEGANHDYPSGTNVVIVNTASSGTAVYKYDVLSGLVDTSSFIAASDLVAVTNAEIDTVVAS